MRRLRRGYQTNCWGPLGGHPVGVTSIKDLTYMTFGDMRIAIEEIAAAGYTGIEMFDGNLEALARSPTDLRALLADTGVHLIAVYSGANFIYSDVLADELARIERIAGIAAEFETEYLVIGGGAKRSEGVQDGDYERLAEGLGCAIDIADQHGMSAHYHPHLTSLGEAPAEVARVFSLSPINFCPDMAHLAAAGGDPAQMIREHAERIKYVHLKDLRCEPLAFLPLGEGELDMLAILEALAEINYDGWVTVELDSHPDPKGAAEESFRYLDAQGV